jgi:hypothetical protein
MEWIRAVVLDLGLHRAIANALDLREVVWLPYQTYQFERAGSVPWKKG